MKKKMIALILVSSLTLSCGTSKPSWMKNDKPQVTQNDRAVLGILFSGLILFTLHTFTTR